METDRPEFVKIYGTRLLDSTLWMESLEVRVLFLGMLAAADWRGYVDIPSTKVLAHRMNMPLDVCERALAVLEAPDLESRTPDEDGRRVIREGSGWIVVNCAKYREARTRRQEQVRQAAKRHRAKRDASTDVNTDADGSADVITGKPDLDLRLKTEDQEENSLRSFSRARARMEFERRFVAKRACSPVWAPKNVESARLLDHWAAAGGDLERALDGFFADTWAEEQGFPIGALANNPAKYAKPPAKRSGRIAPARGTTAKDFEDEPDLEDQEGYKALMGGK
jgi:hypothetical protein